VRLNEHLEHDDGEAVFRHAGAGRVNIRKPTGSALALGDLTAGGQARIIRATDFVSRNDVDATMKRMRAARNRGRK
jgi:hypothetical protein